MLTATDVAIRHISCVGELGVGELSVGELVGTGTDGCPSGHSHNHGFLYSLLRNAKCTEIEERKICEVYKTPANYKNSVARPRLISPFPSLCAFLLVQHGRRSVFVCKLRRRHCVVLLSAFRAALSTSVKSPCRDRSAQSHSRSIDKDLIVDKNTAMVLSIASEVEKADPKTFLPKKVAERTDTVTDATLRCTLDGEQMLYTYTVKWIENIVRGNVENPEKNEISEELRVEVASKEAVGMAQAKTTTNGAELYGTGFNYKECFPSSANGSTCSTHVDDLKKQPSNSGPNKFRTCHGPCKAIRPIIDLHIIGRCENVVCTRCINEAPVILTSLGGSGCPNAKCFLSDVAALCPDPDARHLKYRRLLKGNVPKDDYCSRPIPVAKNKKSVGGPGSSVSSIPLLTTSTSNLSTESTDQIAFVKVSIYERGQDGKNHLRECETGESRMKTSVLRTYRVLLRDYESEKYKLQNVVNRLYCAKNRETNPAKWTKIALMSSSHFECLLNASLIILSSVHKIPAS
ncbi:hypothetical protein QR680_011993 [Steinernema hermaphroditum]|uniref:Uncharacterized protein n=1 Tax=Steinernema hermaphroditum TaxID=289476 RepID=A0AA39I1R9_9BILA|nr:hypothetical protein QR680_011993 [Steinernema hermaphroditum]